MSAWVCRTPRSWIGLAAMFALGLSACGGGDEGTPAVKEVLVSVARLELARGTTATVVVTAVLDDATTRDVAAKARLVSSDPTVVEVIAGPAVKAVAPGFADVTATYQGKSASARVRVTPAALVELELSPASLELAAGTTATITATGVFTDDTHQDLTGDVTWTTSANAIATVTAGLVKAMAPGATTIAASLGGVTASTGVTVTAAVLEKLTASVEAVSLPVGLGQAIVLTGAFTDGRTQNLTSSASWTTSDEAVVAIDAPGHARALAPGSATVTGAFGGRSASVIFTITDAAPVRVELAPPVLFLPAGMAAHVTATATLTDGRVLDVTSGATWSTSDGAVSVVGTAGIDAGRVTAQAAGVALITATFGGVAGKTDVTVTPAELVRLAISPASGIEVASGLSTRVSVTGVYTDQSELDLTDQVTWSSRNTQVATVSNARATAGLVQARAPGTTDIVARLSGVEDVTAITVTPAIVLDLSVSSGPSVPVGMELEATATARMSDGTSMDVTAEAVWSTTTGTIVSVDAGVIEGLEEGTARIQVAYGGKTAELAVTVSAPVIVKLVMSLPTRSLPTWRYLYPTARGTFSDGVTRDVSDEVSWSSSDESIAYFDWDGALWAQSEGDVTITASAPDGDASSSLTLVVLPSRASSLAIRLDAPDMSVGSPLHFQAIATYEDGSDADVTYWASWWVNDESVVQFFPDLAGEASAMGEGTTTVYADLDGVQASFEITVAAPPEG